MGLKSEPVRGLFSSLQISKEGCKSEPERGEQSSGLITGLFCNLDNYISVSLVTLQITKKRDIDLFWSVHDLK